MATAAEQPENWHTAHSIREVFPSLRGVGELALQRLATLAARIAERHGIAPRVVMHQDHPKYRAVERVMYPLSVWLEARGVTEAPADRRPQPVTFNGIRFRSKQEGRTAAFLASMGWAYEYEPEHFELPSGRYRPDFRVMFEDDWTWFEVKHQRELRSRRDPRWPETVRRTRCNLIVMFGLWRPVPFEDSGPARMYQGAWSGAYDVVWSEMTGLFPEGAANELLRQKLIRAYRDAADETFGDEGQMPFAMQS